MILWKRRTITYRRFDQRWDKSHLEETMAAERQGLAEKQAIESGVDVLLALLYAPGLRGKPGEPVRGITRLQKLLFLLWKEGSFYKAIPNLYGFEAYDFGPCMDDLYDDIDFAQDIGLIEIEEVPTGNEYEDADEESFLEAFGVRFPRRKTRRDYSLTPSGLEAGGEIYNALQKDERERLVQVKKRFNNMPFFDLLRYVYQKYPNFAKKSVLSL
jgi:uncharacterized protein